MNKSDIEFCPFCQSVLMVNEIKECEDSEEDDFEIACTFCGGIYGITEKLASPLTKEQVRLKFQGIPLTQDKKKPRTRRKRKAKK